MAVKTVGETIREYRKKAHFTQPALAEKLAKENIHITYKAISAWEKNAADPSATTYMHVCRILGIPDCVEEFFGSNPADPLAELSDEGKELTRKYIDTLLHPVSYRKAAAADTTAFPARVRSIRLYDLRVSAGTGNFADSDQYAEIEVDEEKAKDADFAVTITGDSMMPRFRDHQTVFVHEQPTLENGEIGIFYLNGNVYIKKLQDGPDGIFLISLNPAYKPLPVRPETDTFRIFGSVCG